jgi:predicted dehydrogenase
MKPIVTGLAAYGMSGALFHAPFLCVGEGFDLRYVVERSKEEARKRYPDVRVLRSFEELIARADVELVVVNTPDVTHGEYVRMALLADKHVVVEKPFVFTVEEGEALIALAEERGRILCVYQNRRWDGDFRTIRKILQAGLLGRVVEFRSSYQRWRNFVRPGTWKERADNRVGLTYNLGSHMVDQAVVLFGFPEGVSADLDTLREGGQVDDYYHIRLVYPKRKVLLCAGYLVREQTPRYIIHGTEGSFVKCGIDPQEEMLQNGGVPGGPEWGREEESDWGVLNTDVGGVHFRGRVETVRGNYGCFYDELYGALRNGTALSTAASRVIGVTRILEAAFESAQRGRVVLLK